jgi:hypothetical protein
VKSSTARLRHPNGAAYHGLARPSARTDPRRYAPIHWPVNVPFRTSPVFDACPTHKSSLLPLTRSSLPQSMATKSNVLAAPKAPVVAPGTAALLSVCFMLVPRDHYYCSQPVVEPASDYPAVHTDKHICRLPMCLST